MGGRWAFRPSSAARSSPHRAGLQPLHFAALEAAVTLLSKILKHVVLKLNKLNSEVGGELTFLINKIDDLLEAMTGSRALGWCFAAGTLIATTQGSMAIEQVRAGDWVYSAHEETGEFGIRQVLEVYRRDVDELWEVSYDHDGDPATEPKELRSTGEHPFWSETSGEFVPAKDLTPGVELRLATGETSRVTSVTPYRGPPGERLCVYNFAVADHHTYFAGPGGVWVHNVCPEKLDEYITVYNGALKGRTGTAAFDEAFEVAYRRAVKDFGQSTEDMGEIVGALLAKAPSNIDDANLIAKWQGAVNDVANAKKIDDPILAREMGEPFNILRRGHYRGLGGYGEVSVQKAPGIYFRVDTYIPDELILSRKFRQYTEVGIGQFRDDLAEILYKYPRGTPLVPNKGTTIGNRTKKEAEALQELASQGHRLNGKYVLEVPVQSSPIPNAWLREAVEQGIEVRDVTGKILTQGL